MTQRRRAWTAEDQITAEIAAACGCTLQQIADCLGRSCSTVSRRIYIPYMQKHLERSRAWHRQNPEKSREISRSWKRKNKDKVKELSRRRVNKKRLQSGLDKNTLTTEALTKAFDYFANSCAYCGKNNNLTIDHYIPLSKGGRHSASNVIPACLSCNCSKGAKNAEQWYKAQSYFDNNRLDQIKAFLNKN